MRKWLNGLVLLLALLLGAQVPVSAQFTAQIQIALQQLGIWPYDGTYATTGDVPTWSTALNKFVASSTGGGVISASRFLAGDGTAGAPSYSFASDPDNGLWLSGGGNQLGVAVAGVDAYRFTSSASGFSLGSSFGISWSSSSVAGGTADVSLSREAAGHLFQRNSTNAQRASWANTYTSSTNYEAFSVDWQTTANNVFVGTRTVATGTSRPLVLSAQTTNGASDYAMLVIQRSAAPLFRLGLYTADTTTKITTSGITEWVRLGEATSSATSGTITPVTITPTYNQSSGTAANTDLLINRTQTAVGSGTQRLIDAQVGGVSQFSVSNTGVTVINNSLTTSGNNVTSTAYMAWLTRATMRSPANGLLNLTDTIEAVGIQFNTGTAAPTVSSGGGGSPAIVTGARNTAGSVDIGTGGAATQIVIAFGAPAWTNAPYCTAWVETATLANTRYHGVTTTTTTMTIQANAAWAASSIVAWHCFGRI